MLFQMGHGDGPGPWTPGPRRRAGPLDPRAPGPLGPGDGPGSPLDQVVDQVFDSFLHLRLLQRDGVALIRHLHHQFSQFVQLPFNLEEALCRQSEPEGAGGSKGQRVRAV